MIKQIRVKVNDRKGKEILSELFSSDSKVLDLKRSIETKSKSKLCYNLQAGLLCERQALTLGNFESESQSKVVRLSEDSKKLVEYQSQGELILTVKDLGPQVGWRTVFIVEYAGPILIFSLIYLYAQQEVAISNPQNYAFGLVLFHYFKRELESCFIHIFSRDTMPLKRIFINSAHYWILCGGISIELFFYWENPYYSDEITYALIAGFFLFEFLNLMCHIVLRNLRRKGDYLIQDDESQAESLKSKRGIPYGWGFDFVTCANYLWEILAWASFAAFARCWTSYLFLIVSSVQMTLWALDKHRNLKKLFDGLNGNELYPNELEIIHKESVKGKPSVTSIISGKNTSHYLSRGGRRKLHYRYEDKTEMIEEYDIKTHELLVRKWKKHSDIKEIDWKYEVGEAPKKEENLISISSLNPVFIRKDSEKEYQFRIRNLTYPSEVYSVSADDEKQEIVIKTSNKKYYKRFDIPDLKRKEIKLDGSKIGWVYQNNTLVISYPKPEDVLKQEDILIKEFQKLNLKKPKEGDVECSQQ